MILSQLCKVGLKCNAEKSAFCQTHIEYLNYWITHEKIRLLLRKVQAILQLEPPTTLKEL